MNYDIKALVEQGVIRPKGWGSSEGRQWLVIHTTYGDVVYKEFWVGPGLAVDTEVSTNAPFSDEALCSIAEEAGDFWDCDNLPEVPEPKHGKRFVRF